jgi:hypothetical protein
MRFKETHRTTEIARTVTIPRAPVICLQLRQLPE